MNFLALRKKIDKNPDFINLEKFDNSLSRLIEKYPEGVPLKLISKALLMTEEEIEETTKQALAKLREALGLNES